MGNSSHRPGSETREIDRQVLPPAEVKLFLDTKPAAAVLAAVDRLAANISDLSPEVIDGFVNFFETGQQAFTLKVDGLGTALADVIRVRLDPSDGFAGLMAALGAGDV